MKVNLFINLPVSRRGKEGAATRESSLADPLSKMDCIAGAFEDAAVRRQAKGNLFGPDSPSGK
jgi:hypothetical protein